MAVKREIKYEKEFLSETGYKPEGHHGNPPEEYYQKISEDEQKLREEIIEKFALESKLAAPLSCRKGKAEGKGFDGTFQYDFYFTTKNLETLEKDPEKNVEYKSILNISKAGAFEDLEGHSDLEKFILEKGYNPVKD